MYIYIYIHIYIYNIYIYIPRGFSSQSCWISRWYFKWFQVLRGDGYSAWSGSRPGQLSVRWRLHLWPKGLHIKGWSENRAPQKTEDFCDHFSHEYFQLFPYISIWATCFIIFLYSWTNKIAWAGLMNLALEMLSPSLKSWGFHQNVHHESAPQSFRGGEVRSVWRSRRAWNLVGLWNWDGDVVLPPAKSECVVDIFWCPENMEPLGFWVDCNPFWGSESSFRNTARGGRRPSLWKVQLGVSWMAMMQWPRARGILELGMCQIVMDS